MSEAATPVIEQPPVAPAAAPAAPATPATPEQPAEGVQQDAQDTGESAPPAKPEGDKPAEETPTPEQAAKRQGRRFERKLDAATRRYYEEKARADLLAKQLAELAPKAAAEADAPRMDQFSDIEEYAKAVGKYEREKGIKEYEAKQRQLADQQIQQRLVSEWEKKADRGSSKYDDFDEAVGDLAPTSPILRAIMDAENAEDVAYYLAKHRAEASKILALDVVGQVRAIGKLEAKLLAEPPKPKTPSKAPAPITPVGGASGGASDLPLDTDDINTWMKKENARMRKAQAGA